MSFFVKYPPGPKGDEELIPPEFGRQPRPYTIGAVEPEYQGATHQIELCKGHFDLTGNPLYALEAFRLATSVQLYPPLWVIRFLDERFRNAATNDWSFDKAFGFTKVGSGNRPSPTKSAQLRMRDGVLCKLVFKLEGAGLTRPQACKALAGLLGRIPVGAQILLDPWGRHGQIGHMTITGRGIEKAIVAAEYEYANERATTEKAAASWTDDEKRRLLALFLDDELPPAMRSSGARRN